MIFFSSAEVYGDYDGMMSEDVMINNPIKDTYQMNDYAISKWAGELMVKNSATMFGTETVIVRPVNCYGPHEHYTPYRDLSQVHLPCSFQQALCGLHKGQKELSTLLRIPAVPLPTSWTTSFQVRPTM